MNSGKQAEQQAGAEPEREREDEHGRVDPEVERRHVLWRHHREQAVERHPRHDQCAGAAQQTEQRGLHQHESDEPVGGCAHRGPQ